MHENEPPSDDIEDVWKVVEVREYALDEKGYRVGEGQVVMTYEENIITGDLRNFDMGVLQSHPGPNGSGRIH